MKVTLELDSGKEWKKFEALHRKSLDCLEQNVSRNMDFKSAFGGFPGGTVVKNPPATAGDTGSSPGPGKSHMPWSN